MKAREIIEILEKPPKDEEVTGQKFSAYDPNPETFSLFTVYRNDVQGKIVLVLTSNNAGKHPSQR